MEQQRNKKLRDQLKEMNKESKGYMIKKRSHSEEEELTLSSPSRTDNSIPHPQLDNGKIENLNYKD